MELNLKIVAFKLPKMSRVTSVFITTLVIFPHAEGAIFLRGLQDSTQCKICVFSQNFSRNARLRRFYKVLSTNSDGKKQFISTMEGTILHQSMFSLTRIPFRKLPTRGRTVSHLETLHEGVFIC